jgi:hypothetical protein
MLIFTLAIQQIANPLTSAFQAISKNSAKSSTKASEK